MVETIGICEKHELPLDQNGDCELCRLSDMPSQAPKARSAWWALIIPLLILLAGALWTYGSLGPDPEEATQQGVQPIAAERTVPAPETEPEEPVEREEPKPERVPPRSTPPDPEDIPRPDDFAE
ncbi:MAG: hypothetical protein JSV06_08805 [Myxococcales bacterium]|nr:MAG: hypothetical protein JSV06_08805 [Myxococcales bacterium]